MKKALSIILSLCMILSFVPLTAYANEWTMHADAYVNGGQVDPSEPIILYKGAKLFVCFDTPAENVDHGLAPFVGWSDNYEGGTLSSAGFTVTAGNASDFGFDASEWGFGSDPMGSLVEAGDLAPGTVGQLDYFLYECENFDWAEFDSFDFVNTPRTLIQTLTFIVSDYGFDATKTVFPEYGDTSVMKLVNINITKDSGHQNPLNITVRPSKATFVNVSDATDTHTVDLSSSIIEEPYISYNGENYFYNDIRGYSNRELTEAAGECGFIYVDSVGNDADFAALSEEINGNVVICNRGGIPFAEKCNNAAKYGAAAIIVANNQDGSFGMILDGYNYTTPAVSVTKAFADSIKATAVCHEGTTPYYTGSLTVSDNNTTLKHKYPAEYYFLLDDVTEPIGFLAVIEDWSVFKPDAVYKAVISYTTENNDWYGGVFSMDMPCKTEVIIHKHNQKTVTVKTPATITKEGVKVYECSVCGKVMKTEAIAKLPKKNNPVKAKGKTVKAKENKKTSVNKSKAFTVKNAKGKVTFKKAGGSSRITVASNGKITVKSGLKKGKTYKIKVKVKAAGNSTYKAKTVTVTVKVKIV